MRVSHIRLAVLAAVSGLALGGCAYGYDGYGGYGGLNVGYGYSNYGYGGYGVSQQPRFGGPTTRLLLDGGGVYVDANIRGGGEYGEQWHRDGSLTKKQNVFDDFAAAGEYLIKTKYTDHAHLAMLGGSNGGLLMGAVAIA